jgi:ribosomal subunit interface protein
MKTPLQITFRDMPHSDTLETHIRDKAHKLEQLFADIISCRVVVEPAARHSQQGTPFNVRIDLGVPGSELVVDKQADEDVRVAIRDAFDAAKRQLEDYARQL